MFDIMITSSEVENNLKKLKAEESAGMDEIVTEYQELWERACEEYLVIVYNE